MLTDRDIGRIKEIVELGVRQYFDAYLNDVFPKQIEAMVQSHNASADAHGGIRGKFSKFKWLVLGFAAGSGAVAGVGVDRLLGFFQ